MGGLDAEHRRPRQRQIVDMGEMPVIGRAVDGRILAHRRHHDAVGKRQAAQLDRGKQGTHLNHLWANLGTGGGLTGDFPVDRRWICCGFAGDLRAGGGSPVCSGPSSFPQPRPYLCIPAALITSRLEFVSRFTRSSISAGVIGSGSTPNFFRLSCVTGSPSTFMPAALSFPMIAPGVLAGPNTPNQIPL